MVRKHTTVYDNQMSIDDYENYQSFSDLNSFDIPFAPEPMAEVKGKARRRPVATEQPYNTI